MKRQTELSYLLFGFIVLSFFLHNIVSGYAGKEEPVFFALTFVFALGFVFSLAYNLFTV